MIAAAGGTVDYTFAEACCVRELARGGRVKVFAVASERASAPARRPPSPRRGCPLPEAYTWAGAMVGSKTPAAETAKLAELFTVRSQDGRDACSTSAWAPHADDRRPAQMREFQKMEIALWCWPVQQVKVLLQWRPDRPAAGRASRAREGARPLARCRPLGRADAGRPGAEAVKVERLARRGLRRRRLGPALRAGRAGPVHARVGLRMCANCNKRPVLSTGWQAEQ